MSETAASGADAVVSDIDNLFRERGLGRTIVDASDALVIVMDRAGRIVIFNRACERTTGWSAEEVKGDFSWERLLDPAEAAQVRTVFESLRAGDYPNTFENHWVTRQGDRRLIAWSNTALADEEGRVDYVIGTGIDITSHARIESELQEALRTLERRTQELSELVAAAHAVQRHESFDESARTIFDAARRATGARAGYIALLSADGTENEVLFLEPGGVACTVDPSLPMPVRGLRAEAYRTGKPVWENDFASSEWMRFMPQGHATLTNVMFVPLTVEDAVVGLIGLANKPEDFSPEDARIAESFGEMAAVALRNSHVLEMLRESEQRFRSVSASAADAIVCTDSQGKVSYWNAAAERIFGWLATEIIGEPVTRIMPERHAGSHTAAMKRYLETREPRIIGGTIEIEAVRADGSEFPVELSLSVWESREGTFFTAVIRDITERWDAQAALARVYEVEHRIAETLQTSLLPPELAVDGLQIGAVYRTAHEAAFVGGDFYDAFELDDGQVAVMVGDVSGKGIDAAGLTVTVRSAVRTLAYLDPSPAIILERVGNALGRQLPSGQFATMLLVILDTRSGEMRLASAGHPGPLVIGSTAERPEVDPGPPLGVVETDYPETRARLGHDDCLLLFTDGLTDARSDGAWFGEEGVLQAALGLDSTGPQELAEHVLRAVAEFTGDNLHDDVALVAIRLAG